MKHRKQVVLRKGAAGFGVSVQDCRVYGTPKQPNGQPGAAESAGMVVGMRIVSIQVQNSLYKDIQSDQLIVQALQQSAAVTGGVSTVTLEWEDGQGRQTKRVALQRHPQFGFGMSILERKVVALPRRADGSAGAAEQAGFVVGSTITAMQLPGGADTEVWNDQEVVQNMQKAGTQHMTVTLSGDNLNASAAPAAAAAPLAAARRAAAPARSRAAPAPRRAPAAAAPRGDGGLAARAAAQRQAQARQEEAALMARLQQERQQDGGAASSNPGANYESRGQRKAREAREASAAAEAKVAAEEKKKSKKAHTGDAEAKAKRVYAERARRQQDKERARQQDQAAKAAELLRLLEQQDEQLEALEAKHATQRASFERKSGLPATAQRQRRFTPNEGAAGSSASPGTRAAASGLAFSAAALSLADGRELSNNDLLGLLATGKWATGGAGGEVFQKYAGARAGMELLQYMADPAEDKKARFQQNVAAWINAHPGASDQEILQTVKHATAVLAIDLAHGA